MISKSTGKKIIFEKFLNNYLIAEIGINHNGNFNTATQLIDEAAKAGVDAIKFQYRKMISVENEYVEIGDEVLNVELAKNYLNPIQIEKLANHAKRLGIDAGISFFDVRDLADFSCCIDNFDFFKVPSVELLNSELISLLLSYGKMVLISTGAHSEQEVELAFKNLASDNWMPLHCISNYPTLHLNSRLGYITYLSEKWMRPTGYSSHDENWEVCLLAFMTGAKVIERHITLNKKEPGLDHSTSSTPNELAKLARFMSDFKQITNGNSARLLNQGEIINRQNLGKSYFAMNDIAEGHVLNKQDFYYNYPQIGLSKQEFSSYEGRQLIQSCKKGQPITQSHFTELPELSKSTISYCEIKKVSLPIRFHDYPEIASRFPISRFELHLSRNDINNLNAFKPLSSSHNFTIHLPDYQSTTQLLDPFSDVADEKIKANKIINDIKKFAIQLSKKQVEQITVVGSFSLISTSKNLFYEKCQILQKDFDKEGLILAFQWLPPFAWYFGGSKRLDVFNNLEDLEFISKYQLNICLDTSHFLMGANFYGFNPIETLRKLQSHVVHLHVADAKNFDGEGLQLGEGDPNNKELLREVLKFTQVKVLEPWQGHLNLYKGFHKALAIFGDFNGFE